MADVESVKAGDTLRVPVKVIYQEGQRYPGGPLVCRVEMPSGREDSLSFTDVEAAEHIPAPKVFQRRDVVRSTNGPTCTGGLVVGTVVGKPYRVWVTWPGNESCMPIDVHVADLEHDEAPE